MQSIARSLVTVVVALVTFTATAASATASTPPTCDASVLSLTALNLTAPSLATAGTPGGACTNDGGSAVTLPVGLAPILGLSDDLATAATSATGGQTATARVDALNAQVGLGGLSPLLAALPNLGITADVIEASAHGTCVDDYTTSGQVANLKIAGVPITGPDGTKILDGPIPLTGLTGTLVGVNVALNQVTTSATGISRNAVHVTISLLAGAIPVADITIAHAAAGGGDTCPPSTPGGGNPGGGNPGGGNPGGGNPGSGNPGGGTPTTPMTTPTKTPTKTTPKPNNGTNASTCARIKMWFVPRVKHTARYKTHPGPTSVTSGVEHGVRRVTRGVIKTCKGKPIVRARIDVFHVVHGKKLRKTGIRSRRDGLLTLILPSNLGTRQIRYEYRPNTSAKKVVATATLRKTMKSPTGRVLF